MLDVQRAARELAQLDVASDFKLFACGWPAEHAEARGNDALVDLAVADKAVILAVRHENLAEHLAVIHGATHHAGILHALAVIGEGNGAMGYHVAHLGDASRPSDPWVMAPDGYTRHLPTSASAALHVFDNRAIVGNGIRYWAWSKRAVKPPWAAARVPLAMSSLNS